MVQFYQNRLREVVLIREAPMSEELELKLLKVGVTEAPVVGMIKDEVLHPRVVSAQKDPQKPFRIVLCGIGRSLRERSWAKLSDRFGQTMPYKSLGEKIKLYNKCNLEKGHRVFLIQWERSLHVYLIANLNLVPKMGYVGAFLMNSDRQRACV